MKNSIVLKKIKIFVLISSVFLFIPSLYAAAKNDKEQKENKEQKQTSIIPEEIKITNVRDTTFNVSWVTKKPQTGRVHYGINPGNLDRVSYDDRGKFTNTNTHYVTISGNGDGEAGLTANTTYYFDIISDDEIYNNAGAHISCTTGPTLNIPSSQTVYGQVFKKRIPADGAIVYITISDKDNAGSLGASAKMSCLVSKGYWYVNLGNARIENLNGYFNYSAIGDELNIFAQGGKDGTAAVNVTTGTQLPIPAIVLKNGK